MISSWKTGATATLDLDLVAREDRARSNHLQRQPSGFEIIDESDLHQYIHKIHFRFLAVFNTNLERNCYVLNSNADPINPMFLLCSGAVN